MDGEAEERRGDVLVAFLGAGMVTVPSRALIVESLASARREVAAHRALDRPLDAWLAGEVRLRGIRENAAVLAVMELPGQRAKVAEAYRRAHPERSAVLDNLLACLD